MFDLSGRLCPIIVFQLHLTGHVPTLYKNEEYCSLVAFKLTKHTGSYITILYGVLLTVFYSKHQVQHL